MLRGVNYSSIFLRNRCPTWIYTTALSPADTASALAAIKLIQKYPEMRTRLWQNINLFKEILTTLKIDFLPTESAIICVKEKNCETSTTMELKTARERVFCSSHTSSYCSHQSPSFFHYGYP